MVKLHERSFEIRQMAVMDIARMGRSPGNAERLMWVPRMSSAYRRDAPRMMSISPMCDFDFGSAIEKIARHIMRRP